MFLWGIGVAERTCACFCLSSDPSGFLHRRLSHSHHSDLGNLGPSQEDRNQSLRRFLLTLDRELLPSEPFPEIFEM